MPRGIRMHRCIRKCVLSHHVCDCRGRRSSLMPTHRQPLGSLASNIYGNPSNILLKSNPGNLASVRFIWCPFALRHEWDVTFHELLQFLLSYEIGPSYYLFWSLMLLADSAAVSGWCLFRGICALFKCKPWSLEDSSIACLLYNRRSLIGAVALWNRKPGGLGLEFHLHTWKNSERFLQMLMLLT